MKIIQFAVLFAAVVFSKSYSPFKKYVGQSRSSPSPSWLVQASDSSNNVSLSGGLGRSVFDVMFQWSIMEFAYPSQQLRAQAISTGQFIPENVAPLGLAVSDDRVFVTTPRWNEGIPASLSVIQMPAYTQSPALVPYPNWAAHTSTTNPDCSKLLSVYRLALDRQCGRLFVIDSGIINALTNLTQLCPPKIVAFDLATDEQVLSYQFPPDQVLQGSLHTNIVVDIRNSECNRGFVYVMDVWRNGIFVFDVERATSWRTTNHFYNSNPFDSSYTYNGINFQWTDGVFGAALSQSALNKPSGDRVLYFHPMSSGHEFVVRTSILRNQTAWLTQTAPANAFTPLGSRGKRGQSSTSDMASNGVYFSAQVQLEGVSCWDTRKPYNLNNVQLIQRDPLLLGFVNDLKLDMDRKNIWVVSNNLPTFIYSRLDYSQINFRLLRSDVNRAIANTICDPQVAANTEPITTCN